MSQPNVRGMQTRLPHTGLTKCSLNIPKTRKKLPTTANYGQLHGQLRGQLHGQLRPTRPTTTNYGQLRNRLNMLKMFFKWAPMGPNGPQRARAGQNE